MTHDPERLSDRVSRRKFLLSSGAIGAAGLAGCTSDTNAGDGGGDGGGDGDGDGGGGDGGGDGNGDMELSGDIRISGSSTVYPVAQEVSRRFQDPDFAGHEDVSFNLTRDGSSGGFENVFIPGDSDINNASRPIAEEEVQRCRDNGFEPVEFFVAQDALTIIVNNDNDWVDSISIEDLQTIWSPDTAPEMWSDVNSDWPDEPFDLYGPATTSGTFDYFTETVVGEEGAIREDFEGTEEDDLIAQGVSGNQYAMGYLPFAYYTNNPDETKALSLTEAGSDPVPPSLEGAQSGNYPLARPLFFYANMNKLQAKTHLQEFIRYYLNQADEDYIASEIGYVPSSDSMVGDNIANLEAAIAGNYEYGTDNSGGSETLSGDIRISGSSTVYPVAQEVSRRFQSPDFAGHENVSFNLTRDGSSGGFENVFIPGDSDINNASRPIAQEEVQRCRDNGFEPVEFFVAQDALTIIVNNNADWLDSISIEELGEIWSPDTAPEMWSDVNDDWPDELFDLYGPATTSGTFDYFTETVVGEEGSIREDFEGTEEDDLIAQGVAGNEYALGYLPFAYYTNNPDETKALSLTEGGSDPVPPSLEGAQSGNYPLARPLFFYANMNKLQEKNHLQEFIRYYINQADDDYIASDIGYVPSSSDMVEQNLTNLQQGISGDYEYST